MLTELIIILFGLVLIAVTLLFFAIANGAFRAPQEVDPSSTAVSLAAGGTLMVPGAAFVDAMAAHVEGRARALARIAEKGDLEAAWSRLDEGARARLLREQLDEVYLAVKAHVAAEQATLLLVLPELRDLDALARDAPALPAFAQALAAGKWPTPPAAELERVKAAVAAALRADAAAQHKTRVAFVAIFRRSCLVAFALAVCDKVGAAERARAAERAVERAAFFRKLGRSALMYAALAVAIRLLPMALDGTLGEVVVEQCGLAAAAARRLWSARGAAEDASDEWEVDDGDGGGPPSHHASIFASGTS